MRYEAWAKRFRPIPNHLTTGTAIEGQVFLPFGDDLAYVKQHPSNNVWSFIVVDGARKTDWIITNGFHCVNLMGFLVTEKPAEPNSDYEVLY